MGYAWTFSPAMIQLAAAVGVYGLSFMSVVLAALPATLAERRGAAGLRLVAAGIVALAAVWVLGTIRLAGASGEVVPGVRLRIVQANIAQPHNWRPDRREAQFRDYLQLSSEAALTPVTHLIWPETAAPFFLSREPDARPPHWRAGATAGSRSHRSAAHLRRRGAPSANLEQRPCDRPRGRHSRQLRQVSSRTVR